MADPIKCLLHKGMSSVVDLGTLEAGVPSTELDTHGVDQVRPVFDISDIGQSVAIKVDGQIDPESSNWFRVMEDQVITVNGGSSFVVNCETLCRLRFTLVGVDGGTPTVSACFTVGGKPTY